jgi:hypothetical protein
MKLRKDQRYTAYIIMREAIKENVIDNADGFCWLFKELFTEMRMADDWENLTDNLPELTAYKPAVMFNPFVGLWFNSMNRSSDGRSKRIAILNKCIKELEQSL